MKSIKSFKFLFPESIWGQRFCEHNICKDLRIHHILVFSCSNVEVYYAQFCHTLGNIFHHCPCKPPPCFSINSFTNTCRTPMISSKNITTFYHDLLSSHCICRCTLWPFFLWVSLVTCIFPQFCSCQQDVVWHLFPLLLPLDTVIWS